MTKNRDQLFRFFCFECTVPLRIPACINSNPNVSSLKNDVLLLKLDSGIKLLRDNLVVLSLKGFNVVSIAIYSPCCIRTLLLTVMVTCPFRAAACMRSMT